MKNLLLLLLLLSGCTSVSYQTQDIVEIGYKSTYYVKTAGGNCTGFALDYNTIITAAHCIDKTAVVLQHNEKIFFGVVLLDDDVRDIAIIHTDEYLLPLSAETGSLKPGQLLVGIGHPFYAGKQLTFHIGYYKDFYKGYVMASEVCYRGMSGGPVLNQYGQVVGICSRAGSVLDIYNTDGDHSHVDLNLLVPIGEVLKLL